MRIRAMLLALVLVVAGGPVVGQQQVHISAEVPVVSPTGSGTRNLLFGTIMPTATPQTVSVVAAVAPVSATVQSGEFRYNIQNVGTITFNVSVPAHLTLPGADPLVVNFNGTQYGGHCATTTASCTLTPFNPVTGGDQSVCRRNPGGNCPPGQRFVAGTELRVYVGGLLTVPPTARAGVYTGTITLNIISVT